MATQHGLPVDAYISPEFFALEQQHIFSNTWAFAGLTEDLVKPGDYLCVQAGLVNIIVIKGEGGQLSAFHNRCRHRGTPLVDGKGHLKNKMVCPYHDWTYDLKGNLLSLPKARQEFASIDKACHGLLKANVGLWRGMIWVHPDQNSVSLDQWFAPINEHLGPHDVESLIEFEDRQVVEHVNANWKVIVENYIDHYHLAHLHSGTLNMYDHKQAEFGFVGPHFKFWEPLSKHYQKNIKQNSPYPLIIESEHSELDGSSNNHLGTWVPMLFPGIGLAESESSWSVFHIIPLAVDKSKIVIRTKMKNCSSREYLMQSMRSSSYWAKRVKPKNADYDKAHPLGSADFLKEDIYVCEQLQRSFSSPFFSFGPSAEHGEKPIREHQQVVWGMIKKYRDETSLSF